MCGQGQYIGRERECYMARVNSEKPPVQLEIERELRQRYGNRIRQKDLIDYFHKSRPWVAVWLRDVPAVYSATKQKLYSPERIAREIYNRSDPGAFE